MSCRPNNVLVSSQFIIILYPYKCCLNKAFQITFHICENLIFSVCRLFSLGNLTESDFCEDKETSFIPVLPLITLMCPMQK